MPLENRIRESTVHTKFKFSSVDEMVPMGCQSNVRLKFHIFMGFRGVSFI